MQRERALPARAGPSRTSIFAKEENANKSLHLRQKGRAPHAGALWRTGLYGHVSFCEPVLRNGRLYVATMRDGYPEKCGIYCLDSQTGDVLWFHETSGGFHSNISVEGDHVYAQYSAAAVNIPVMEQYCCFTGMLIA